LFKKKGQKRSSRFTNDFFGVSTPKDLLTPESLKTKQITSSDARIT